jgi:hypothetical protein
VYNLVKSQPFGDETQWTDSIADPMVRGWRYKLTAVNSCGIESDFSEVHKTIHLTINQGLGGAYNLIWDDYEGFVYGSVDIYRHTNQSGLMLINTLPASLTSYTDNFVGGTGGLYYLIEVIPPSICTSEKAQDHNSTRSNRTIIAFPAPTSISESVIGQFSIFPNPAKNELNIITESDVDYLIEILDISGAILKRISNQKGGTKIDLSDVANGVYFINAITEKNNRQFKFVVSK